MSKMNQKQAVFGAVTNVKQQSEFSGAVELSSDERVRVAETLFKGFRVGEIELDRTYTDRELKIYISGLVSNWLRKDTRLNGGVAYVPKNPGSRAGSSDPQLKALRALLKTLTDPTDRAEVQQHIDARVAEISASKKPKVDLSALPEALKARFVDSTPTSSEE